MPTIYFIHGMWSSASIWDHFADYFQSLGYATHTPSLPQHFTLNQAGHVANLSLRDYLAFLEDDYRKLDEEAIIIGHSMGALLAQQLAERMDPKALVLLAPAPASGQALFDAKAFRTLFKSLTTPMLWRKGFKPSASAARYGLFNAIKPEQQDAMIERLCFESGRALCEIALWYADPLRASRVRPQLIESPILSLVGAEDRITPAAVAKRSMKNYGDQAQLKLLSGHGHWLPREPDWQRIAQQIHVWLCWQLGSQSDLPAANAG